MDWCSISSFLFLLISKNSVSISIPKKRLLAKLAAIPVVELPANGSKIQVSGLVELVQKLGEFDLDPCTPINAPFLHAKNNFTTIDNGLIKDWFGRVYLNPPYGRGMELWLEKLKYHGNGIALIFARTETKCFFEHIWNDADAILFVKGRIRFYHISGIQAGTPGAPSVFIA